ncbi:hypothetical protein GP486_003313 [Trichoglossum hirsutum]|uniref:Uncharacterized protein n=1 Tax=Trichoglossum hirsutum TaxID=265104 RepID=A0A9P8LDC6_9PEZI|nr:hypothetical protein GP486_003313 [Trichoglossum hirsutum]
MNHAPYFYLGLAISLMSSVLWYSWHLWSKVPFFSIANATPSINADVEWHPPNATGINNLTTAINGTDVYGFIFNSSMTPGDDYGVYNFCNMPHVRRKEYKRPDDGFELKYVEVDNTFPIEPYPWSCSDESLFYYGQPQNGNHSAHTYWRGYQSPSNPFQPSGFQNSSCQFPQITRDGLEDSWRHGRDLWEVYHDMLRFLPGVRQGVEVEVTYRVTGNVITSQVAGMVVSGMYGTEEDVPLLKQPSTVDSLEPTYSCPPASDLFNHIKSTSAWAQHLDLSQPLFNTLDSVSDVPSSSSSFHVSWDHYFDNLSARLCHQKPLPCKIGDPSRCVTQDNANAVFRLGEWEYSYIYRDAPESLSASAGSFGVWIAELTQNIRDMVDGKSRVLYRHNIAHDGSLARLLSILQVEVMVWPGMGSEVVFEVYSKKENGNWYIRVLWGGKVLRSSSPQLGVIDMVPLDQVLAYFDGLVGVRASRVVAFCTSS